MKYILKADYVLAGPDLEPIKDGAVVVEDSKILYVGDAEQAALEYPGAEEISHKGTCLMPGMFECHNHLAMDARLVGHLQMMEQSECEHTVMALKGLTDDLMSGVTTARCMGDRNYIDVKLKRLINEGKVIGPNLLVSGIGMRAEHGHGFVGIPHCGVEEFRRTCRENMAQGVDVLKIFITPGTPVASPDEFIPCFLTYDEVRTVVEEASSMNIRTAAHCIGGRGLEYCVKAGIDVIEHVYSITPEEVQMVEEEFDGWIDLTSGIALDPTREPMLSASSAQRMRDTREYCFECVSRVCQSDKIRYTFGTDAYHGNLYRELIFASECGAPNDKIIKGVTVTAADMCGIPYKTGQLTPGMDADIICVEGNPLEDVRVMEFVPFVMKDGIVYKNE